MSEEYNIYDEYGRKVGTVKRKKSPFEEGYEVGQQTASIAIFLYLFWKPILAIALLIGVIMVITGAIRHTKTSLENMSVRPHFVNDIISTTEQGVRSIDRSLSRMDIDPLVQEYFAIPTYKFLRSYLYSYISKAQKDKITVKQDVSIDKIEEIVFIKRGFANYYKASRIKEADFACIRARVSGMRRVMTTSGNIIESTTWDTLLIGLVRRTPNTQYMRLVPRRSNDFGWYIYDGIGVGIDLTSVTLGDPLYTHCNPDNPFYLGEH